MAVKIKLKRMGRTRAPHYRIVVADARAKRDGRSIEEIGKYHPKQDPSGIELDSDRAQYWLGVGAQPTEAVAALLRVTGDWQRYKGLPGAEGTLKTPEARTDKKAVFADAARAAMAEESTGGATSSKGNSAGPTAVGGKPEAKSTEAKSTEAKSTEAKSTEAKSTEAKSTEAKPADEASPAPGEQAAGAGADSGDPSGGASGDAGPGA